MKDILFIIENLSYPFDRRVHREALTMKNAGYNVSVICPAGKDRDKEMYSNVDGVNVYRYPLLTDAQSKIDYLKEYSFSLIYTFFLSLKILLFKNFDIIHIANPPDIFFPILAFYRIFGKKIIFDQHDLKPESYLSRFSDERKDLFYQIQLLFEYLTYKSANAVISTNNSYLSIAKKRGNKKNVWIVRNGPDMRYFKFSSVKNELKEGFKYLVSYIGIMGVQDGVDYLINAIDVFVNHLNRKDTLFVLIGKGDDFEYLKSLAEQKNIMKYVRFTGRIPDVPAIDYLSTSDICASPDPYNPLNDHSTMNKVMEYMVTKSPIVSFDLKEARFSAEESAVYIKDNDYREFAGEMSALLDDFEKRKKMAEIGYKRVTEVLCWERQESNLLNLYKTI